MVRVRAETHSIHPTPPAPDESLTLSIETPVSILWMVDIGERVCLYAFMHVSMRLRSSMILSSTCAVAGWWRAGGGAGRGWWLQRGRAGQQEPATTTRHSLPYSLSLSRSLCPTACEKMKCSGRMSSWFNRCHKKFLLSQGKVKIFTLEILKGLQQKLLWKVSFQNI